MKNRAFKKLSYRLNLLFGRSAPGNSLAVMDDDTFIASYPKSGNTWTRFLVANLIRPQQPVTFLNIHEIVPDPDSQSRNFLRNCPRPRVIKSHYPFDPRYKRVISIVRDPRDVALSQYHFQIKRALVRADCTIEDYVRQFVTGHTCDYGSWGQNVGSWLIARYNSPGFLLLRYEDLIAHPEEGLGKMAELLGLTPDRSALERAVALSSADNMRKLEQQQAGKWEMTKASRKDIPFVRSAKAGGWESGLPREAVALIEQAWGPIMRALGYQMATTTGRESDPPPANPMEALLNNIRM
ncbi:MAG: sulfotransferase domain-containing protein [Acidobacteriales bacterium]|nr:sulfotransferase domain-containing protein [Terriglobales bacterium]